MKDNLDKKYHLQIMTTFLCYNIFIGQSGKGETNNIFNFGPTLLN